MNRILYNTIHTEIHIAMSIFHFLIGSKSKILSYPRVTCPHYPSVCLFQGRPRLVLPDKRLSMSLLINHNRMAMDFHWIKDTGFKK